MIKSIPPKVKNIMQTLILNKYDAYIIGGAVRDYYLGVKPHDYDIFTNATGEEILKLFPKGKIIGGDERQAKILTVIVDDIEVSQYRANGDRTQTGNNLEAHLATCDYNVNAMACDIKGKIIDNYSARFDIRKRKFCFVGDCQKRIDEDPLRLMRGLRLLLQHKLTPSLETETFLEENNKKLKDLPQERIRDELMKLLKFPNSITILKEYGYLKYILPELHALVGLDAGPHHSEEDCFEHSNFAFRNSCELTSNVLLRFAVLLHDIGKAPTAKVIDGSITFYRHELFSDRLCKKLMKRLKFTKAQIKYVCCIARNHMMGPVKKMRAITFARICDDLNNCDVPPEDMIVQTYSDNQANLSKVRLTFHTFIKENPFLRTYYEYLYGRKPFNKTDLEVSGKDLIAMGFDKGPIIGTVLEDIFKAVHEGKVINRKDRLMEYIKNGTKTNSWNVKETS